MEMEKFKLFVTHIDGEGPFVKICGQTDKESALQIESLISSSLPDLQSGVGTVSSTVIIEGIVCVAKYKDGNYYRAKITDISSITKGLVGVHFIDFGNKDVVSVSTIKFLDRYPKLLSILPGQASEYLLAGVTHNLGKWDEPVLLKLQSILCFSDLLCSMTEKATLPHASYTFITAMFGNTDLAQYLISHGFGVSILLQQQISFLPNIPPQNMPKPKWQGSYRNSRYNIAHNQFNNFHSLPTNPASVMRIKNVTGSALYVPFQGKLPLNNQISNTQRNNLNQGSGFIKSPHKALSNQIFLQDKKNQFHGKGGHHKIQKQDFLHNQLYQQSHSEPSNQLLPDSECLQTRSNYCTTPTTYKANNHLEVNKSYKVFVSYAEQGPELFAVQLMSDSRQMSEMMKSINCRPYSSLKEPPMIGSVCLGRMSGDDICRAIVMGVNSDTHCTLFFVDFGDTEIVSYYDIFEIPEEFIKPKVFAMRFCLSKVKLLKKSAELNQKFKELVYHKAITLKVVPAEGPPLIQYGELYLEDGLSVYEELKQSLIKYVQAPMILLKFNYLGMLPLNSKCSVLVSYVDSCIKFYVQLIEKLNDLNKVMSLVKQFCESSSLTPAYNQLPIGLACCAKFPEDGVWYRAEIVAKENDKITVFYVDYGNKQTVNLTDVRLISPELVKLPAQAIKCALKDFEDKPVETKTSNQLEMLALEKTLIAQVVGIHSNHTTLVRLVDESVTPPLDVARRMTQLSMPRNPHDHKPKTPTPARKEVHETNAAQSSKPPLTRSKSGGFRSDKFFRDDQKRGAKDDNAQRQGSFRQKGDIKKTPPIQLSNELLSPKSVKGQRKADISKAAESGCSSQLQKSDSIQNRIKRVNAGDTQNREQWPDNHKKDRWDNPKERFNERNDRKSYIEDNKGSSEERNKRNDKRVKASTSPQEKANRSFESDGDGKHNKSLRTNNSESSRGRGRGSKDDTKIRPNYKPKLLPSPVSTETPFKDLSIEVASQHEVSVTWFVSPGSFYVQLISLQSQFLEMMQRIPNIYKGVKPFSGPINAGASVLAKYPDDGVLYRALVIAPQPFGKFIVQYVDFGNKFLVDARDIWQLDAQLMDLPKMAIHCSLLGILPSEGEWKMNAQIDQCFNAPRYQCIFQELVDSGFNVSLWNNGVSVADILIDKQLANVSEQQTTVTLKDEPIDLSVIVGQQILCSVTHVESFEKMYIQLDLEKAAVVEKAIADFNIKMLSPLPSEALLEGTHCTIMHEGKLFRAILTDTSDPENIKVVLPDYGNTIATKKSNLMNIPNELSVYYYQSLQCRLHNFTSQTTTLLTLEELKSTIQGKKFIAYINDVDGICLLITFYDISSGKKIAVFKPDPGAYEEVVPLCARSVFNYNFGMAFISHIENFNEIYLQRASDTQRISKLLDDLFKFYEEGKPESLSSHDADALCAARSEDGNWYRGTILATDDIECKIQFADYGNYELVPHSVIKKLDPSFFEPCTLAIVISLGLVPTEPDSLAKLLEWTTDKELQVTLTFGDNGWLATLHMDGIDLSAKLIEEKLALPHTSDTTNNEVAVEVPIQLPPGCTQVYVSHIDSPGQFWLQTFDKVDKIDKIQAELQENSESYENLENRDIGILCVAKYSANDMWYRAEILDCDADITTVRFVDFGNTDVLDNIPGILKVIPTDLSTVEHLALKSSVNAVPTGTGQWSEPASDFFTELIGDTSKSVDALIVLKDVKTYVDLFVDGRNLTDKLVSEGHATRSEETDGCDLAACFASHVNSPSEFWIQLDSTIPELQYVESAMADAENFPTLDSKEEGIICAAKYQEDGAWYRAQIIVDGSEGTEVLFMDYGNASITDEIRKLPDDLKSKPALSRKCALQKPKGVKAWSRRSEVMFSELAAEGATIFNVQFIASGDISIVELYLDGKSITEDLVFECEATPQLERPLPIGQDVMNDCKVCHIDSPLDFYVRLDSSEPILKMINESLSEGVSFDNVRELKVGTLCAAFCSQEKQWYRAKIIEFCFVGSHVRFLDYGKKVRCEELRKLPDKLKNIEPLAINCSLYNITDNHIKEANEKFNEFVAKSPSFRVIFLDSIRTPTLVRLVQDNIDICTQLVHNETDVNNDEVKVAIPNKNDTENKVSQNEAIEFHESMNNDNETIKNDKNSNFKDLIDNKTDICNVESNDCANGGAESKKEENQKCESESNIA